MESPPKPTTTDSPPKTMKAWVGQRTGAPAQAISLQTDRPVPGAPTGSDLLIKISHAALNPADAVFMRFLPTLLPFRRAPIPGLDFAGHVVLAGPDAAADLARPGTPVCGALAVGLVATGRGSLAEYVVVPAELVAPWPRGVGGSAAVAAGLGVVGQTAAIALREAGLMAGDRVLVNGASGGLGNMLVQLSKGHGAYVVGVCSAENEALVRRLGADETIDYTVHDPLHAYLAKQYSEVPFDYIFDCVGHQVLFDYSPGYLATTGKVISLVGGASHGVWPFLKNCMWPGFLGGTPRTYKILGLKPSGELQRQVVKWFDEGLIKEVPIDSEYDMEDVLKGYERVVSKRSKGKVVIKVG